MAETVKISGTLKHSRVKALLIATTGPGGDVDAWIPKSQITGEQFTSTSEGPQITCRIPRWLAQKKGLI